MCIVPLACCLIHVPAILHDSIVVEIEPSFLGLIAYGIRIADVCPSVEQHGVVGEHELPLMPLRIGHRGRALRYRLGNELIDIVGIHVYPVAVYAHYIRIVHGACRGVVVAAAAVAAIAASARIGAAAVGLPDQHKGAEGIRSCFGGELHIIVIYGNAYSFHRSGCDRFCYICIVVFSVKLSEMQKRKLRILVRSFRKRHINGCGLIAGDPCVTIVIVYKIKVSGSTLITCFSCRLTAHSKRFLEAFVNQKLLSVIRQIQDLIGKQSDICTLPVNRTLIVAIYMKRCSCRNNCRRFSFLCLELSLAGSYRSEHIVCIDITHDQGRGVDGDVVNRICTVLIGCFNNKCREYLRGMERCSGRLAS